MLDLHAVSSAGGTTLTAVGTVLLGNDGASNAGVPVKFLSAGVPVLLGWGGMTTIADTLRELQLLSQDSLDPINGWDIAPGASSLAGIQHVDDFLPYTKGKRQISMRQNTAAANNMGYTMDYYPGGNVASAAQALRAKRVGLSVAAGAALTAITWGATAINPTTLPPAGNYAILGAWVNALTNYGLLRFSHARFDGYKPGFPVIDSINTAIARAVASPSFLLQTHQGYQFVRSYGECPVFPITSQGTGLTMELASITADTPTVTLNLSYLGTIPGQ